MTRRRMSLILQGFKGISDCAQQIPRFINNCLFVCLFGIAIMAAEERRKQKEQIKILKQQVISAP